MLQNYILTRAETNIAPARKLPQKETNLPTIHFQVLCHAMSMLVSGRVFLKKNNETKTEIATVPQLTRKHFTKKNKKHMVAIDKNKFQIEFKQELRYKVGPYQL